MEAAVVDPTYARAMSLATRRVDSGNFHRQAAEANRAAVQWLDLTWQEINCWRMYGIRVEWFMDELIIEAP